jgi:hypothetical protein
MLAFRPPHANRYLDNDAHNSYAIPEFACLRIEGAPGKMPGDQTNRLIKFGDLELDRCCRAAFRREAWNKVQGCGEVCGFGDGIGGTIIG